MFITNSPAPSRINSAELPQRDVTVWEFAIFGYFPCIIRTVRTRSFNHKHKHRKMAIFCYFFSRFFFVPWIGNFLIQIGKKTYFLALGTRPNIGRQNGPKKPWHMKFLTLCILMDPSFWFVEAYADAWRNMMSLWNYNAPWTYEILYSFQAKWIFNKATYKKVRMFHCLVLSQSTAMVMSRQQVESDHLHWKYWQWIWIAYICWPLEGKSQKSSAFFICWNVLVAFWQTVLS